MASDYMYISVLIDEVDASTRTAWAIDKTGARIQCAWRQTTGGIVRIPAQGEYWTAERRSARGQWHLDKKFSNADEHDTIVSQMTPGDVHISGNDERSVVNLVGKNRSNGNTISTIPITIAFS